MAYPHRGEIWLADLRPTRGREQTGRRPVLVLSVDFFNAGPAELVVVLPLTSTKRDIPLHVNVRKGDGGTRNDSVVLCEAIRSVSKDRLTSRWGMLSQEVMTEVEDRLRILLDLWCNREKLRDILRTLPTLVRQINSRWKAKSDTGCTISLGRDLVYADGYPLPAWRHKVSGGRARHAAWGSDWVAVTAEPALSGVEWVPAATSYAACLRPAVAGLRRGKLDYETTDRWPPTKSDWTDVKHGGMTLELELIVILMCADPEPVVITVPLASKSAIVVADFNSVNFTFLAKPNEGCRGLDLNRAKFLSASFWMCAGSWS